MCTAVEPWNHAEKRKLHCADRHSVIRVTRRYGDVGAGCVIGGAVSSAWSVGPVAASIAWSVGPVAASISWSVEPVAASIAWSVGPVAASSAWSVGPVGGEWRTI
jgi:hypothetical protein